MPAVENFPRCGKILLVDHILAVTTEVLNGPVDTTCAPANLARRHWPAWRRPDISSMAALTDCWTRNDMTVA